MSFEKINIYVKYFSIYDAVLVSKDEILFFYTNKQNRIWIKYFHLQNKIEHNIQYKSPLFEKYFDVIHIPHCEPIYCCKYNTGFLLVGLQSKNDVHFFMQELGNGVNYVSVKDIIFESSFYDKIKKQEVTTIFYGNTMDVLSNRKETNVALETENNYLVQFSALKDNFKIYCFIRKNSDSHKSLYCIEYDCKIVKKIDLTIIDTTNTIDVLDEKTSIIIVVNGKCCFLSRSYYLYSRVYVLYLHKNYLVVVESFDGHTFGRNKILVFLENHELFVPFYDFEIRNVVIKKIKMPLLRHHLIQHVIENHLNYLIKDLWHIVSEYYSFTKFV